MHRPMWQVPRTLGRGQHEGGDAMVGLGPGRAVDVAASQLVATEAGLAVGVPDEADLATTPLDLSGRFHIAAAHDREGLALMARATR